MASHRFKNQRAHKSNHRQAAIQHFRTLVEPELRLRPLNIGHLGFDSKCISQALVVNDITSSHGGLLKGVIDLLLTNVTGIFSFVKKSVKQCNKTLIELRNQGLRYSK